MSKSIEQIKNLIAKATKAAKSGRELSVKGLNFGRWWYEVGEYEKAAEWITKYLRVYDKDDKAYKLLGDIYEKLNKSDAALNCYKNSLRARSQQYELMLKVAEMHINPGPTQNPGRAQVWLDKAAVALPNNPQVYKLKMELLLAQQAPPAKLEEVILAELKKRPNDPSLYVQYVSFLRDQERLDEAFAYSHKRDNDKTLPTAIERDLEWTQCLIDTCQDYAERMCDDEVTAEGIKAYSLLLMSLCRSIWLCMEQGKYDDALENLAMLDTSIFSALTLNQEASEHNVYEWEAVLTESKGQLYWLTGTFLIHKAMQGHLQWTEAVNLSAACYSVSLLFSIPDSSATWATRSQDSCFPARLKAMAGLRLSQSCHMLYNLASTAHSGHGEEKENEREWMQTVTDNYCTEEGRHKVFNQLFGQNYNVDTSMIYNDHNFTRASVRLVTEDDLSEFDNDAVSGLNLQTWVWTGLQWHQNFGHALDPYPWISSSFPELQLITSSSVKHGYVWHLCSLDIESFIIACVLHAEKAAALWEGTKVSHDMTALRHSRLPLPLSRALVTNLQSNWWDAVRKLHSTRNKEKVVNLNQLKATLRHGMESIRGSGNHGLQLMLIIGLAKHFAAKAYTIDKDGMGTASAPWLAYQRRAAHYWMLALPLLQDVVANRVRHQTEPKDRLFPKNLNDPTLQEARSTISEVYMCNGGLLVQEGDLKGALDTYGKADTPHASFCEALIFKQLLDDCGKGGISFSSGSASKRRETLSRKYQSRLEVTLSRLQRYPDEDLLRRTEALLHPQNASFAEEPKLSHEKTPPKQELADESHPVNFEDDDSIIPIPGKQSTPKNDMWSLDYLPQDRGVVAQISQNLSALTTAVSSLQAQQRQEQEKTNMERKDQASIGMLCDKLAALTDVLSGLQLREERNSEQQKKVEQQLHSLQEQVNRSQIGTPAPPSRVIHLSQTDGSVPVTPSPLQVFDKYQHAALGQMASPGPASPYYGALQYQAAYSVQNPAMAAAYAAQGYPLPPGVPAYAMPPRVPQPGHEARGVPSPVNTPPVHIRSQQHPNAGLPMSKEAADALSLRFQATLSGNASPTQGTGQPIIRGTQPAIATVEVPGGRPMQPLAPSQSYSQSSAINLASIDQRPPGYVVPTLPPQYQRMSHAYSEPVIGDDRNMAGPVPARQGQQAAVSTHSFQQDFKVDARALEEDRGYDASYISPSSNDPQRPPNQDGTSMLRSLLISRKAAEEANVTSSAPVEINYPKHIHFPEKGDTKMQSGIALSTWNFRFETPEEMDRENKKLEADEEAEDAEAAHNDTGPHFEPVVSLPEIEVKTGEEDEEALFSERAKLYRWHQGEWKERGLGNMKVLKHKETGKHRLLMRREQVFKICCNHVIGKDLDLNPMHKSDRAWVWHAVDFSEEESKLEKFAIRFKTPEIATTFQEKVLEGRSANEKLIGSRSITTQPAQYSASAQIINHTHTSVPASDDVVDAAPGGIIAKQSSSDPTVSSFRFAFPKPSAAAIDLAARIAGSPKQQETTAENSEAQDKEGDAHNESDGPHFEPIVKLPDKIETKTGEEDEEVMFCNRAKLYRYADKQWKERGIGDIKILQNKTTNKFRVVMRREQVLKLCANHYITVDMKLSAHAGSDKAWHWSALDYSDPDSEPQQELLAVRFKLAETAADFKKNFDIARDTIASGTTGSCPVQTVEQKKGGTSASNAVSSGVFNLASYATDNKPSPSTLVQSSVVDLTTTGRLVAKRAEGSWQCPECYSPNDATEVQCPCCNTRNPSAPKPEKSQVSGNKSGFQFGSGPKFNISTKPSGYSFGVTSVNALDTKPKSIFGAPSFTTALPTGPQPGLFNTGAANKSKFSFGGSTKPSDASGAFAPAAAVFSTSTFRVTEKLLAKKDPGTWDCPSCSVNNDANDKACPCCGERNPGLPDTAKAQPGKLKPGAFNLVAVDKGRFSFGLPSKPAALTASTTPATQSTQRLVAIRQTGSWDCPTCAINNDAKDEACPCCGAKNPNLPSTAPKAQPGGMQPGLFDLNAVRKGGFSFGIPTKPVAVPAPKPANDSTVVDGSKSSSDVLSPPKFTFGNTQKPSMFGSKLPNNNNSSGSGVFSSMPNTIFSKPETVPSSDITKPKFPSVGYEEDDSSTDESSDASSGSSYDSSYDEDEYEVNEDCFRSPLSRPQGSRVEEAGEEKQEERREDDDVICLGEVLPPVELQRRAEKLMLPKHFYNYLKDGEDEDDRSSSEEEKEKPTPGKKELNTFGISSSVPRTSSDTQAASSISSFGFAASSSTSTFADLAKQSSGSGFGFSGSGWVGMTNHKPLFANLNQVDTSCGGDEAYKEQEDDNIHFEPIVKLPDKVSLVTGEEDDETIYSQRCKLFRWNLPTNEWKERGVGEIKMQKNRSTGRIRIIMRREQVLKVCANHYIRPGMTLEINKGSDRAWTWTAMDFAEDEEPKMEKFAARFKNVEFALEFKENFERCQMMLLDADPMTPCKASALKTKELSDKAEKMKNELQFFKDKFTEPTKIDLDNTITDELRGSETNAVPVGALTPLVAQHNMRKSVIERNMELQSATEVQKLIDWNKTEHVAVADKPLVSNDNKFSFNLKMTGQEATTTDPTEKQTRDKGINTSSADDPQAETDVHFEPIVQLPERVELLTGEEDEQVLFGSRGKLYVFDSEGKQWKERGLGDVKIMQNLQSCKVRVLMRREQVLKVCLNHFIQQEMKLAFKEKSDKVLLWTANDFSDDEMPKGEVCNFAMRFKDHQRAEAFRKIWDEGVEAATGGNLISPDPSAIDTSSMATGGVTSPGPGQAAQVVSSPQSPESPVKSTTPLFSFANVQSPFKSSTGGQGGTKNVMGFTFGKTPQKSEASATPSTSKFTFDMSKMSFNFGSKQQSTPQRKAKPDADDTTTTAFFTPTQNAFTPKNLFSGKEDQSSDSTLFSTPNETLTRPDAPTMFSGDQSPTLQVKNIPQAQGSSYKPSPLAMVANFPTAGTPFSVQGGSKYQFKPQVTNAQVKEVQDANKFQIKSELTGQEEEDSEDVIFVWEATPTEDQRNRALKLLLPPTFYLYEDKVLPEDYDEHEEEEKEDRILQYIRDRDSRNRPDAEPPEAPTLETPPSESDDVVQHVQASEQAQGVEAKDTEQNKWVFGGAAQGLASFATMTSGIPTLGFRQDPGFQFPGAGQVMFQSQTSGGEDQDPLNYKCEAQFKPVLDELPPLIEVKTGEEGEEILFKERCRLYRFDKKANQWKERGVGEIKILYNNQHKLHRVVMRRDQVLKVCANHVINEDTNPVPHLGSLKTCSYFAMDYSENPLPTPEKFAIRFKTEEICKAYTEKIAEVKSVGAAE